MEEMNLAFNLRAMRVVYGYSQDDVSQKVHIARQTYSLYESGRCLPDTLILCRLADLYHVSIDYLLYGNSGQHIAESSPQPSPLAAAAGEIHLTEEEARMVLDYKSFPDEIQQEIREYVRFKKHLTEQEEKEARKSKQQKK